MRTRLSLPFAVSAALALAFSPAAAQRRPPTPEQRIDRLEKQVRQVQRQVFPKGQPADTAGVSDDPAATQQSVSALGGRLDSIEAQMAQLVQASEENGNRLSVMEAELARLKADEDRRLRALESAATVPGASAVTPTGDDGDLDQNPPPAPQPRVENGPPPAPKPKIETSATTPPAPGAVGSDAGPEAAYDAGFRLWESKRYDDAINALNAMASQYPDSRRVSWARNLAGRALLDKGEPRAAAEALLANYRRDPKGERAQDSLFYLGQSLVKLGQPGQACKAYAELEDVYGSSLRAPLKASLPNAKAEAKCG